MILIAFVFATLWFVQFFVLPAIVHRLVVSKLAQFGYSGATVEVDHVSLTSATLRNIHSADGLDVRLVHLTYTPRSLLAGRVDDLAVEDAFVKAAAFRKPVFAASAPADRPPVSRMTITRAQVELPTPTGPATADVRADAQEQDRRLVVSADASMAGIRLQTRVDAQANLSAAKVTARLDGDLASIALLIGRKDVAPTGQIQLQVAGDITSEPTLAWNFPDILVQVNADAASAAADLQGARLKLLASASGTAQAFVAKLKPESSVSAERIQAGETLPAFALLVKPRELRISREGDTWSIQTEGAEVQVGDLQFAFEAGQLAINNQKVQGRIGSTMDLAKVGQSQFLQQIFPVLGKMQLGGIAQVLFVRAADAGIGGEDLPSLTLRVIDGTIASQQYELAAEGINSQVVLIDPANPRTPAGQTLKMSYGKMGKWEVRDALFQFALKDLNTLAVERTELGWAAGRLWTDPYEVSLTSPIIRSRVYGKELDLGKVMWVATGEKAWAEGLVDLDVPVTFSWPRMRFGDGFVVARPGGTLHLDYVSDQLGRYLIATDPRFGTDPTYSLVRERVMKALRDFRFSTLRMVMKREEPHLNTIVQVQGKGNHEGGQEVNLNVNVDDLDWLLSRYLALPKAEPVVE